LFPDAARFSNEVKINNPTGGAISIDGRPITLIRRTSEQIDDQFVNEDDPQYNDRSPTRERTLRNERTTFGSQCSTSRTIQPRHAVNSHRQITNLPPLKPIVRATKQKSSLSTSINNRKYNLYI